MTDGAQQRIETALKLIEGQAALLQAHFPTGIIPVLPLHLAAAELIEALRLARIRRLLNSALIEALRMEGAA